MSLGMFRTDHKAAADQLRRQLTRQEHLRANAELLASQRLERLDRHVLALARAENANADLIGALEAISREVDTVWRAPSSRVERVRSLTRAALSRIGTSDG